MIEYQWHVTRMKAISKNNIIENYVFQVYYEYRGTDTTTQCVASVTGDIVFAIKENVENFVPFEQLDESTVIGWIEIHLGDQTIENFKNEIQEKLNSEINDVVPPWIAVTNETDQSLEVEDIHYVNNEQDQINEI
jgi:hypothetical protein